MTTDQFLQFFFHNNKQIIGATLATVLLFVIVKIILDLRAGSGSHFQGDESLGDIQKTLRALLERSAPSTIGGAPISGDGVLIQKNTSVSTAKGPVDPKTPGDPAKELQEHELAMQEIQDLRKQVAARESTMASMELELNNLKANEASSASPDSGREKQLEAKVRDLESKLTEYAIIEDDIADLTNFKEENTMLKRQIEELRMSSGQAALATASSAQPPHGVPAGAPPGAPAGAPAASAESEGVMIETPEVVVDPTPVLNHEGTDLPAEKDGDIMAEFDTALKNQRPPNNEMDPSSILSTLASTQNNEPEISPDPTAAANKSATNDPLEGSTDTDRMMAEIGELNSISATASDDTDPDILKHEADTDKMLSEANDLNRESA